MPDNFRHPESKSGNADRNMKIRRAEASDCETMAEIHRRSWLAAYSGLLPAKMIAKVNAGRSSLWERLLHESPPRASYFLGELDGKPAGMIVFGSPREENQENAAEIHSLYLLPEYQHRGIGSKLIAFAMRELKKQGFSSVFLWVLAENRPAIACYEKNGFRPDGRKETIIGKTVTELRYSRSLSNNITWSAHS